MKFYSLDKTIYKSYNEETKIKVEYFWHFWDFLFTKNRDLILSEEPKVISHITLLNKIEKHLVYNNGINSKKLLKYSEHIYFKKDNILLRSDNLLHKRIKAFKSLVQNFDGNRSEILEEIHELKTIFFNYKKYSGVIIKKLNSIVFSNKNLISVKSDIKFLCNSIVDILIFRGYSTLFIRSLLKNVILNSEGETRFKYKKRYIDFDNDEDYRKYIKLEFQKITLKNRLEYLLVYLTQPKNKGFHFFKIEGFNFNHSPIKILGVKFYNPTRDNFLTVFDTGRDKDESKKFIARRELFHTEHEIFGDLNTKDSTCNAIVPVDYFIEDMYFDTNKEVPESYRRAIDKMKDALNILKNSIQFSSKSYWERNINNIKPSLISILTNKDYCYHSSCNIDEENKIDFELDITRKKMLDKKLSFINSISNNNNFLIQLSKSHSALSNYKINFNFFDFKSIWIECVEPFFNNYSEFVDIAKKVVLYRTDIFSSYQALLNNSLDNYPFSSNYALDKKTMTDLGIYDIKIGERLDGNKIKENYHLIPEFSILDEFKNEMKDYQMSDYSIQEKINNWITITIQKVYDERNIETHYNLKDYYLNYTLKRDILKITSIVIGAFTDSVYNKKASNITEALLYIKNKTL